MSDAELVEGLRLRARLIQPEREPATMGDVGRVHEAEFFTLAADAIERLTAERDAALQTLADRNAQVNRVAPLIISEGFMVYESCDIPDALREAFTEHLGVPPEAFD